MFFGRKHEKPGMSMKTKFLLILFLVGLFFVFKDTIMAHFGMEPAKPTAPQPTAEAPNMLPETVMVLQNATVFMEPGQKAYATVSAGQPVSVLDIEDKGQAYIAVRHNGMAGYIARRDLKIR